MSEFPKSGAPSLAALAAAKAAAQGEIARTPKVVKWSTWALALGGTMAVWASIGVTTGDAASVEVGANPLHVPIATGLAVLCGWLGALAVLSPDARGSMARAAAGVVIAAGALVFVAPVSEADWTVNALHCTLWGTGFAVLPGVAVFLALRTTMPTLGRAIAGGICASSASWAVLTVTCGGGSVHVALSHLPVALIVALACVIVARLVPARNFSP